MLKLKNRFSFQMLKSGSSVFRRLLISKLSIGEISASDRRFVHKDFHAPQWDLKRHRVIETYEDDKSWQSEFRRRSTIRDRWDYYDQVVWRPDYRYEDGQAKQGESFYVAENVRMGPLKLWYACNLIRGRSVDDADKQLQFLPRKCAVVVREILQTAVDKAVNEHEIEFRTNLWVAECVPLLSLAIKGIRRHARERWGEVKYKFSDVHIRLEEGQPPPYTTREPPAEHGYNHGIEYLKYLRDRRIRYSL